MNSTPGAAGPTGTPPDSILIVEDDSGLRELIVRNLRREGYRTAVVGSGQQALDWLQAGHADLILLDYSLPDMRGEELVGRFAERAISVPFIVATGHGSESVAVEMMKRGARDYLVKGPSLLALLPSVVARVLSQIKKERELAGAQAALLASERRFRLAVDNIPDVFAIYDAHGRFQFINARGLRLLGRLLEDFVGRTDEELFPQELTDAYLPLLKRAFETRTSQRGECTLPLPTGQVSLIVTYEPILDEQGRLHQVFGMAHDVTERKRAEEKARTLLAELAHVTRLSTMGAMVSELAHEINQPLYAIANFGEACSNVLKANRGATDDARSDLVQWIGQILEQARRAAEIIRGLNRFVRKSPPRRTNVRVEELVHEVASLLQVDERVAAVQTEIQIDPDLPEVCVDRIQIEQVLANLLLNAVEAMLDTPPADRRISVWALRRSAELVEVVIRDNGHGLDPDKAQRVFDPYYTTKPEGMGMGLAISRSIVEAHEGRLWAVGNADRGATFHFTLPIQAEGPDE